MSVSVFKKERVHPMAIKCRNGHALVMWVDEQCDGGHIHQVASCPMRRGSARCGDVTVLPEFGPGCDRVEGQAGR